MKLLTALAVLSIATLPQFANAADIPANGSTKAVLQVGSTAPNAKPVPETKVTFEKLDDIDWLRLQLTKGQGYVITNDNRDDDQIPNAKVVDKANRTIVKSRDCAGRYCVLHFTSPVTGTEYLSVHGGRYLYAPEFNTFYFSAYADCADSIVTLCKDDATRQRHGAWDYADDHDFYRLSFLQGHTYSINLTSKSTGGAIGIRVVGRDGKVLLRPVYSTNNFHPATTSTVNARFTASYTGPFFVDFTAQPNPGGEYASDYNYQIKKLF